MRIIFRNDIEKQKLFDGVENILYNETFMIDYNQKEYSLKVADFENNSFEQLVKITDSKTIDTIVNEGQFIKKEGLLTIYTGTDDLRLYYFKKDNLLFILAFGEFQPTRYKLYLEGVWNMN